MTSITDKRHTVKLETLGPIHIGSGNLLQNNIELVEDNKSDGVSDLYVIDTKKILDIIGIDKIDTWVTAIDRGENIKEFIARLGKRASPEKYSKRVITNYAKLAPTSTLKECMHDGRGIAYIPGSSIKGAIRTAILATTLSGHEEEYAKRINYENKKFACSDIEETLFGSSPNENIFRFIQVGDAFFEKECEVAINAINLNITERNDLIDKKKSQIVEAIADGKTATFSIKIETDKNKLCSIESNTKRLPEAIDNINKLFSLINSHTLKLVESEISYWQDVTQSLSGGDDYIENLQDIQEHIKRCKEGKECILRIGHASGWRFTTGAWSENLATFESKIVPITRLRPESYSQYDFPKSRRIGDEYSDLFGFVKLTLQ